MANNFKVKNFSNSTTNTSQALFTAAASTTLVKSIIVNCDKATPSATATLKLKKSGGAEELIRRVTVTSQDVSTELLYDVLPLEAGDALYATSSDTDLNWMMSWVENTASVIGQSIDVLSDVDTAGKANGDVLTYNSTSGNWEAEASAGGGGNNFGTIAVATQSNVVADASNDTLTFAVAGGMAITTNATTDTITFDSKQLDTDDVTLQGARLIDMNGESLTLEDSTQLHPVAVFTSDSVDLREVSIRAMDNGNAGYIQLFEAANNGTNGIRLQAPTNLAASTTYTLPSADGTSGQVLSTSGSGGLSWITRKATQVTGKTVTTGSWSLVSGFYRATISDAAISSTSIVDVIPDNADAATAATAGVLPRTDSNSGSVYIYATTTPAASITVTLNILDL
jgi:hypothetical protein